MTGPSPHHGPGAGRVSGRQRQGTVATFDGATGAGSVLLDDGSAVPFDAAAFAAGGLRHLRLGQRVRLDADEHDVVCRVTLVTMP